MSVFPATGQGPGQTQWGSGQPSCCVTVACFTRQLGFQAHTCDLLPYLPLCQLA